MDLKTVRPAAAPAALGAFLAGRPAAAHHHGPTVVDRAADHAGRRIVIRTTYEITVDGAPLAVPLVLTNEGVLHCHALPNYQFDSAVDLVKGLIDQFPEDFAPAAGGGHGGGHVHGGS